jgi:hypothetical protein
LSYKLRKILEYEAAVILCTDVYIHEPGFLRVEEVIERSDVLIVGAPHREYRQREFPESKWVFDVWNVFGKGPLFSTSGKTCLERDATTLDLAEEELREQPDGSAPSPVGL